VATNLCFNCACSLYVIITGSTKPTMFELNRYVVFSHANKWKNIGIELLLDFDELEEIDRNGMHQNVHCFQKTLNMWLKNTTCPNWNTLEVAITNVNRLESGLPPVSSVYGKDLHSHILSSYIIK